MLTESKRKYLADIYFSPSNPVAFSGINKVWKYVRKDKKVTKSELKEFLLEQDVYTSFQPHTRRFKRRKIVSPHPNAIFGSDVGYMTAFANDNNGYGYFVVFIDLFTRFAWTYPLKTLRGQEMTQTLSILFKDTKCEKLFTDKGSEYMNKSVTALLKKEDVEHYTSLNETKVAHAERLIKHIKRKLYQNMYHSNSYSWVQALEEITVAYNNSYHRSIQMTPIEAKTADQYIVWNNQYYKGKKATRTIKLKNLKRKRAYKFLLGDRVKLSVNKRPFEREYDERYTTEVFTIYDRSIEEGFDTYKVKDEQNEAILGTFCPCF